MEGRVSGSAVELHSLQSWRVAGRARAPETHGLPGPDGRLGQDWIEGPAPRFRIGKNRLAAIACLPAPGPGDSTRRGPWLLLLRSGGPDPGGFRISGPRRRTR